MICFGYLLKDQTRKFFVLLRLCYFIFSFPGALEPQGDCNITICPGVTFRKYIIAFATTIGDILCRL